MDMRQGISLAVIMGIVLVIAIASLAFLEIQEMQKEQELGITCSGYPGQSRIALPEPSHQGTTLEDALGERRSVRTYEEGELTLTEVSMLLWAGDGITSEEGFRTAPSAGGLYPIDIYMIPGRVENASCGIYRYLPGQHELMLVREGNFTQGIYEASYLQGHIRNAAAIFMLVATPSRTTGKYGDVGEEYVLIEAGHIAQNMLLEAVSLNLSAVPVGGFGRDKVGNVLQLNESENAIYMVAVGR